MKNEIKFEEALKALEKIVKELEEQECSLEESMKLYKQGVTLLKNCTSAIDQVEKELIVLNENDVKTQD